VNHRSSVESALDDIKTGEVMLPRDKPIGNLLTGWVVSGIEMARSRFGLLCGTAGTCAAMLRETAKESPFKAQSTEARRRGGLTRSSNEGSVMDLEPRSQVVLPKTSPTREGRSG
jgi:ribosomal protein L2